jgi:hypothetical protein
VISKTTTLNNLSKLRYSLFFPSEQLYSERRSIYCLMGHCDISFPGPLAQLRSARLVTLVGFFIGQKKATQDRMATADKDWPAEASSWALEM